MTEDETTDTIESTEVDDESLQEKLQIESPKTLLRTLLVTIIAAFLYLVLELIQWPYIAMGFFNLGLLPSLALVATVGAVKGPLAGFLTGYLGTLLTDLMVSGDVVAFTLYGVAVGVLGLVAGLGTYDLVKGKSLAKLSILAMIGMAFTALLTVVFGLFVEGVASIVSIGFQLLPLLTLGLPTVILLTPIFARVWHATTLSLEENEPSD